MKFYRVKFTYVDNQKIPRRNTIYLFSPLKKTIDVSRYMFNVYAINYKNGFFLRDIEEISLETFSEENKVNLGTMVLVRIEEED